MIITLLKKPNGNRTKHELDLLDGAFKNIKFFESMKEQLDTPAFQSLFKEFTYEYMPSQSVVFQIGFFSLFFWKKKKLPHLFETI